LILLYICIPSPTYITLYYTDCKKTDIFYLFLQKNAEIYTTYRM
jgi:hypothetical protein